MLRPRGVNRTNVTPLDSVRHGSGLNSWKAREKGVRGTKYRHKAKWEGYKETCAMNQCTTVPTVKRLVKQTGEQMSKFMWTIQSYTLRIREKIQSMQRENWRENKRGMNGCGRRRRDARGEG